MSDNSRPPSDLSPRGRGRELWRVVTGALELDGRDLAMLHESARLLDRLDGLEAEIKRRGLTTPDGRVQPCVIEARQQAITLARVLAAMRLPEDLSNPSVRPQRRTGARGFYDVKRRDAI